MSRTVKQWLAAAREATGGNVLHGAEWLATQLVKLQAEYDRCQEDAEELADIDAELRESLRSALDGPGAWIVPLANCEPEE